MSGNSVFNATVCLIGIFILAIHSVNLFIKKDKRTDENVLLQFFLFTILHFATYLAFTLNKARFTADAAIIAFYTAFYIMNNLEVFFLFRYARSYVGMEPKTARALSAANLLLFAVFVALDVLNVFTGIFFTASGGAYLRSKTMILSQGYQFLMFAVILLVAVTDDKLTRREKTAFGFYCFLPLIAILLQNCFKGYAIAYASIVIAIEILFLFLNAQKNIVIAREEEKNKEAQIRIMLSQIQPHFVYNSLSSISTLISLDPEKAQAALDNFTEYLRHNIASLTETRLIPFEEELKHVESYVALEKMRFGDRVRVVYDLQTTDFYVPPLSIQPLVENAIKHGILKKLEGGNLTIRSYEAADAYVAEVLDDGVGFCMEDVDFTESKHFGLNNIRYPAIRGDATFNNMALVRINTDGATVSIAAAKIGMASYSYIEPVMPDYDDYEVVPDNGQNNSHSSGGGGSSQAVVPEETGSGFADVAPDSYYADAVKWAVEKGITNGTDATHFSPNASCTRAQMVTFLWRAAGSPEPAEASKSFGDVDANAYYAKAVQWAVEQGITLGTGEGAFSPNATVSRAQSVTFLFRAFKGTTAQTGGFADVEEGAFYYDAVQWAVEQGITLGTTGTTFSPQNECLRGQIVTFLYRAYNEE